MRKWFEDHKGHVYSAIGIWFQIVSFPLAIIGFGYGHWKFAIIMSMLYCIGMYMFYKWNSFIDL